VRRPGGRKQSVPSEQDSSIEQVFTVDDHNISRFNTKLEISHYHAGDQYESTGPMNIRQAHNQEQFNNYGRQSHQLTEVFRKPPDSNVALFGAVRGDKTQVNNNNVYKFQTQIFEKSLTKNQAKNRQQKELEISKRRLNDQVVIEMLAKRQL